MLRSRYNIIEFAAVVITGLCIYCINIFWVSNNVTYKYSFELWTYGRDFFHLLYPLIFSIPFCWILFHEKSGYWKNVFNRVELSIYIRRRFFTAILLSAIAMFLISTGSFLFAHMLGPGTINFEPQMANRFYGLYQLQHPVSYALILSCWRSILAVLYTVFSMIIAMVNNNFFIAMTGAFVYSVAENFVTAILGFESLSICTSFDPQRLAGTAITFPKLMAGPAIMMIAITLLHIYYCKKTKYTLMD